ncbi:MAG: IPT/TIG domain-containing protein, partial [Candidatus Poribacteria bacterium]|nr:IPT/TIG domain-containing protein [Candidatus Poribacteria bacterium]
TGEQAVMITTPSLDSGIFAGQFIYLSPADTILTGISPIQGRLQGGEIGKITGGGFRTGATVSIGYVDAANVFVTPTIITFTIPSGTAGQVDVAVKNPDGKSIILSRAYTYIGPPAIERIKVTEEENMTGGYFSASAQPLIPVNPHLELTIDGTGFIQTPTVFFGTRPAQQVEFISSEKLRATLPQIFFSVGPLDVVATNSDGQSGVLSNGVTVLGPIRIKSINPTRGGLGGGTKITIVCESTVEFQGTVFPSRFVEDAKVFIGEAEAAEVTIQSDHIITAITPANNSGSKNVTVVNPDGSEDTFDNGFIYNPLPAITLVKPNNGKLDGGTKIEIMGSGFLLGATVQLVTGASYPEASAIEVISISDELIVAVTPKFRGQPGLVDVWVTNPDRQRILYEDGFTYNPLPTISKISPSYGLTAGGTIIAIEGTGFLPGARVFIGNSAATTEFKNQSSLEAVTPPNLPGSFDLKVVNPDSQETVATAAFLSVSETVYNYPNPFRASQGTTFRYVANEEVKEIKVQIFNLNGEPIGLLRQNGGGEIKWHKSDLNFGLYVYHMEVQLETGQTRTFQKLLQVE